jgi:hypothetical protein
MKNSRVIVALFCFGFCAQLARAADEAPVNKETPTTKEAPAGKEVQAPKESTAKKNEISDILNSMGYPELQVVPRASERLAIEAKAEDNGAAVMHWPLEVTGLATVAVSFAAKANLVANPTTKQQSDAATISSIGAAVGLGTVASGVLLGLQRPYRSGLNAINKYPGKDDRSMLLRERLAEEDLEKAAETMRVVEDVVVTTNVIMNVASAWHANETGQIVAAVGVAMSFLPWVFEDRSIEIYEKQIEYKKKIYVPLASASFHYEPLNKSFTPEPTLTWMF